MLRKIQMLLTVFVVIVMLFTACKSKNENAAVETESSIDTVTEETMTENNSSAEDETVIYEEGIGEEEIPVESDEELEPTQPTNKDTVQDSDSEQNNDVTQDNEYATEEPTEPETVPETENEEQGSSGSGGMWSVGEEEI